MWATELTFLLSFAQPIALNSGKQSEILATIMSLVMQKPIGVNFSPWIFLPIVILIWITLLFLLKKALFKTIHNFTQHTKTHLDDVFTKSADFPFTLLIFTSAGVILERLLPLATHTQLTDYFVIAFKATTIIAIILFVDRFLNRLIYEYSQRVDILKTSGGVARGLVRILVIGLGVLILLDSFGVSITPIMAS